MSSVRACFLLRIGPDLVSEPFEPNDAAVRRSLAQAQQRGHIDGALDVLDAKTPLACSDIWDHLDAVLVAWISALRELSLGAARSVAVFPDTRIECEMSALSHGRIHVEYELVNVDVDRESLEMALGDAARRLLDLADACQAQTPALTKLRAMVSPTATLHPTAPSLRQA